jgi:hypothetical protein
MARFSRLRICPLKVTLLPRNDFATGDAIPTDGAADIIYTPFSKSGR